MMRLASIFCLILVSAPKTSFCQSSARIPTTGGARVVAGNYVVKFRPGANQEHIRRQISVQGGKILQDLTTAIMIHLPLATAESYIQSIRRDPAIADIQRDTAGHFISNSSPVVSTANTALLRPAPVVVTDHDGIPLQPIPARVNVNAVPGQYIITFRPGTNQEPIRRQIIQYGGQIVHDLPIINGIAARLPHSVAESYLKSIGPNTPILSIEQDQIASASAVTVGGSPRPGSRPFSQPTRPVQVGSLTRPNGGALSGIIPNRFIVAFRQGVNRAPVEGWIAQVGGQITSNLQLLNAIVVTLPQSKASRMVEMLRADARVQYVEQDQVVSTAAAS